MSDEALSVHDILASNTGMADDPTAGDTGQYEAEPEADIQERLEDAVGEHPDFEPEVSEENLLVDTAELQQSAFREAAEQVASQYQNNMQAYQHVTSEMQRLEGVHQQLQQIEQQEDWANMDPHTRSVRQAELRLARNELENQFRELQEAGGKIEEAQKAEVTQYLQQQNEMVQRLIPSWRDPDVRAREAKLVKQYLKDNHFTPQEVEGIADARIISLLHQGMLAQQKLQQQNISRQKKAVTKLRQSAQRSINNKHLNENERITKRLLNRV